jgi:hypothetical protein
VPGDVQGLLVPDRDPATWAVVAVFSLSLSTYVGAPPRTRKHRSIKALKPVYTAPSEQTAKERFPEFTAEWGHRYPAIVRLWESS